MKVIPLLPADSFGFDRYDRDMWSRLRDEAHEQEMTLEKAFYTFCYGYIPSTSLPVRQRNHGYSVLVIFDDDSAHWAHLPLEDEMENSDWDFVYDAFDKE